MFSTLSAMLGDSVFSPADIFVAFPSDSQTFSVLTDGRKILGEGTVKKKKKVTKRGENESKNDP